MKTSYDVQLLYF